MKRFVIVGVDSFANRGVEALVGSIATELSRMWPDCRITILSQQPENDAASPHCPNSTFIFDGYRSFAAKASRKLGFLHTPFSRLASPSLRQARAVIRKADLVISTGGDIFGSDYGGIQNYLTPLQEATRAGVKFTFLGHSIGPFKRQEIAELWTGVARDAALITCRETTSFKYVTRDLGLRDHNVALTADVAFLLQSGGRDRSDALLADAGADPLKPCIGLSMSGGITKFAGLDDASHTTAWAEIVRNLKSCCPGHQIVAIPHVWDPTREHNNDMRKSLAVARATNGAVAVPKHSYSAGDYKALLSSCEFVVAERMHAAIAGLSTLVPTVPVAYSVKARGIIADLFEPWAEDQRPILEVADLLTPTNASRKLLKLFEMRQEIHEHLAVSVESMIQRSRINFELLHKVVS